MPTSYRYPGVYVEEISTGARPIEAVGTSTAGFVGIAPKAEESVDQIRWFDNWTQFVRVFAPEGSASTPLANAVFGFFLNGGSRCCVVNVGKDGSLKGAKKSGPKEDPTEDGRKGLELLDETDDVAIVAAPGFNDPVSHDELLSHCENRKNRVAILDGPYTVKNIQALTKVATAKAGTDDAGGAVPDYPSRNQRVIARGSLIAASARFTFLGSQ